MSNRRKTARAREWQRMRNIGNGPAVHTDGNGNVRRGQGRNNFAYGPLTRTASIVSLHNRIARQAEKAAADEEEE